jgi:dTDP-4-amino-4,6-dideoxygalactose transaminase
VENRDGFTKKMKEQGIAVSKVHDRNDKHACLQEFRAALPNTDEICSDMICIPSGWWVGQEEREYIVDCIEKGW